MRFDIMSNIIDNAIVYTNVHFLEYRNVVRRVMESAGQIIACLGLCLMII